MKTRLIACLAGSGPRPRRTFPLATLARLALLASLAGCATAPHPAPPVPAATLTRPSGPPPLPPLPRNARLLTFRDGSQRIYYHPLPKTKSASFDYKFHGAGMFNDVTGPDGSSSIHAGETGKIVITVINPDDFGCNLLVTSVSNTVGHIQGPATTQLLTGPITLPSYLVSSNYSVSFTNYFQVLQDDLSLPEGVIQEDAMVDGADLNDGPGGNHNPLNFGLEFPNALRLVQAQNPPPNPEAPVGQLRPLPQGWVELTWTNLQAGHLYHLQCSKGYPLQWENLVKTNWAGNTSQTWTNHVTVPPNPAGAIDAAYFRLAADLAP